MDAMAIARVGADLAQQGVLLPLRDAHRKEFDGVRDVNGLIGIHTTAYEASQSNTSESSRRLDDTDASGHEMRQWRSKAGYMSVEDSRPSLELQAGAGGVIHRDSHRTGLDNPKAS